MYFMYQHVVSYSRKISKCAAAYQPYGVIWFLGKARLLPLCGFFLDDICIKSYTFLPHSQPLEEW